jgi:2-polyprenyl-3-methyl-5-hydroxy-6-metoxy-1,4-benzoquinol methylase/glycosyltransferase involved in cell wall biosynthesis
VKLAFFIDSISFTPDVIAGTASLGGSESACLGLARALQARGHSVSIFATKLAEGCDGPDAWGVTWDHARNVYEVSQFIEWDVFCALRIPVVFSRPIRARLRLLWNQDMLIGEQAKSQVMSVAWAIDHVVYVSQYHRKQWEGVLPELQPIGWVTKNGYDPSLVPMDVVKHPKRIIHISRPERGLAPLLQMWPKLRELVPDAELQICRYNSMYDAQGWGKVCAQFDQMVEAVNQQVGGITYLGELGKPALYKAIAEAAVMWYPGIVDFAETSCWAPETPVAVPGGHKRIDAIKPGDLVLSYSESEGRIVAKRVKWCRRTGTDREVLRLTYKWRFGRKAGKQESIVGTPDHKMLRRDGKWTTLGQLSAGDSLMPLFRKGDGTYIGVGHDGTSYRYEHDIVGEAMIGRKLTSGEIVHHEDGDGQNNAESNLRVMQQSEHIRHHRPRCPKKPLDLEAMHAMRGSGLPQHAIAAALGTTQATISRRLSSSNHTVVSVESAGRSDVWDMEVEDTHTFIAGHVVAHNCIAAIEAQANGTPFVGSFKGALPETVPSGVLFSGDAMSPEYQIASVQAVATMLRDAQRNAVHYRELQKAGRAHVAIYAYEVIADEWEQWLTETFAARYETRKPQVLDRLLHEDDHTAAELCANRAVLDMVMADDAAGRRPGTGNIALRIRYEDAGALCRRVARGEEQGADDYAKFAIQDPLAEWQISARFHSVAPWFKDCRVVLDVACGNGALAIGLALSHPEIRVVGLDYAEQNIVHAKAAAKRAGVADRLTFLHATVWDLQKGEFIEAVDDMLSPYGEFDGLFVGEFLEHVGDAPGLIDALEELVQPGALVVYTVPNGPFSEMLERHIPRKRGHVHHFQHDDLTEVFGEKVGIQFQYFDCGVTPRGSQVGHWLIQYRVHENGLRVGPRAKARPYAERITRTRPHPKLSVGIIAKNAGLDIARCLESVWPIADEIVVGDTGSEDDTKEIAARYGATVLDLPSLDDDPDGFSGARNKVLDACTGEWFLWIDTDEVLCGREQLWKYLDTTVYHGFAIKQNHVSIQDAPYFDRPVRVFRRTQPIRFYGCIHEQPQMRDCNGDITPALAIDDVQIAHMGYLTEGVVRRKLFNRNLPLLMKDQQRFPERRLGKLLTLRDCINLAEHEREQNGGRLTEIAKKYYSQAVGIFEKEWLGKFEDKYYGLARPFYERALREIAGAYEFEVALAGRQHTLGNGRAKTERVMVRKLEHVDAIVTHLLASVHKQAEPVTVDVEPVAKSQQPTPVEAA